MKYARSKELSSWKAMLPATVMWAALGMLPLIKGSLLLPFAAAITLAPAFLVYCSRIKLALFCFFLPTVVSLALWMFAGQSFWDLMGFIRGNSFLTSGYSEAMSTSWSVLPAKAGNGLVLLFLLVSAAMLMSVIRSKELVTAVKVFCFPLFGIFLFVPFKHGFVGVSAISSAFASLAIFLIILQFLYSDRSLNWLLCFAILTTTATSIIRDPVLIKDVHDRFGVGGAWTGSKPRTDILKFCMQRALPAYARSTYKRTWATYSGAWNGINLRLFHPSELNRKYSEALLDIRKEYPLAVLSGAGDIYAYDQSVLLASENKWNPRPVLQSYSAYTPELARLDEQHLRGDNSPDWIAFDLQTIGNRLPSLDDGMSWPAIFDNYSFLSADEHFVLLRRKQSTFPQSSFAEVSKQTCGIGKTIALPQVDGPLFAEIDLKPTLAGKIATTLLNPPQLSITIVLKDGTAKKFRVISEMMKTGFLISPFIADTSGFASLMRDHQAVEDAGRVQSISITPAYGGSLYWSGNYQMALRKYVAR